MSLTVFWLAALANAIIFSCLALEFGNDTDRLALLAFKANIITDPFQVLRSWNESVHFCQWRGVICSNRHQRVIQLDLGHQKLTGSLSPYIGNLSFLGRLHLQNNSFSHVIPPEVGSLRRLRYLWLYNNSIGGQIPSNISACSKLIGFDVSYNKLVGGIPEELGSLLNLQEISVSFNNLTGSIPPPLGNLSSLVKLNAAYNSLFGSIPVTLGKLSKLEFFALPENQLSGTIPPSIFNLSSISTFTVTGNQIQGTLPWDLGITLPNLTFFAVTDNQLTGSIPASMSNLSNMAYLQAGGNNFTGGVPNPGKLHKLSWFIISTNHLGSGGAGDVSFISSLTNASDLEILAIDNNNFGGVLPKSFRNLSANLVGLWMGNNQISGNILDGISNFVNLTRIQIRSNQFTGSIPPDIGMLQYLQVLQLSKNRFSGKIPSSLGNLSLLNILYLDDNDFYSSIPSELGKCQSLIGLAVSLNNLSGKIPQQIFDIEVLSYLDLSQNHLSGSLPIEIGNLKNVDELHVYENLLSGEIPSTLGSCIRLNVLYMSGNFFQGPIPSSFSSLRGIQFLDLSGNNLSGQIPEFFGDFDLQYLNLSFNKFEGNLPVEGIFKNASSFSVTGNSKLCGGIPELHLPRCHSKQSKKKGLTFAAKLIITLVCGLLGLSLLLVLIFFCWFRKTKTEPSSLSPGKSFLQVTYGSLLEATDGFSSANLIGMGSYGSVYKGVLEHDGTIIAVKVLNLSHSRASRSFLAECEALRNVRHRNLVKVLTACSGVDYQGNDFKALVYDFMANGSLEEWLHTNPREDLTQIETKKLSLVQRLNVVIDVACALDYLHHDCQTPMAHCDLKPSNVLLDNELVGHLGDFGLARFLPNAAQSLSVSEASSIGVRGSIGYTAPEYGMGGEVSTHGDVYSFGILLLEVFTGKRPTDDRFEDGFNIHNFAEAALSDKVFDIVDPALLDEREEETSTEGIKNKSISKHHKIQECFVAIFRVGIACSAESARERMDIADAAAELHSTRGVLLKILTSGNRNMK